MFFGWLRGGLRLPRLPAFPQRPLLLSIHYHLAVAHLDVRVREVPYQIRRQPFTENGRELIWRR